MNLDTATDEEIAKDIIAQPGSYGGASMELATRVMVKAQTQSLVKPGVLEAAHRVKEWFAKNSDHKVNYLAEYFVDISRGDSPSTTLAHEDALWILSRSPEYFKDDTLILAREFDTLRQARGEPRDPHAMTTTPETPSLMDQQIAEAERQRDLAVAVTNATTADDFAARVVAAGTMFGEPMLALAKAYESQRERIADLEDDVERLRPINPFVSEVLFRDDDSDMDMDIETSSCGGIDIVQRDHEGRAIETTITNAQGLELASALSEWAGLSVVDWRPICELKSGPVSALLFIPTDLGSDMECSHEGYLRNGAELQTFVQAASATHWAPLPKPPKAKS